MGKPQRCAPRQKPFIVYSDVTTTSTTTTIEPDYSNNLILPNSGELCPTTTIAPTTTKPPRIIDPNFPCSSYSFLPSDSNGAVITFSPCDNDNSISQIIVGSIQRLDFCAENDGEVEILSGNGNIVFNGGCDRFKQEEKTTTTTTTTSTTSTTLLEPLWEKTYTFDYDSVIDFDIDYAGNYIAILGTNQSRVYIKNNTTYIPLVSNNTFGNKINLNYISIPGSIYNSNSLFLYTTYFNKWIDTNTKSINVYKWDGSLGYQLSSPNNKSYRNIPITTQLIENSLYIFEPISIYSQLSNSFSYSTYRSVYTYDPQTSSINSETLEYAPFGPFSGSKYAAFSKDGAKTFSYYWRYEDNSTQASFLEIAYSYDMVRSGPPLYQMYIKTLTSSQPFYDINDIPGIYKEDYSFAFSHDGNVAIVEYNGNFVIFKPIEFSASPTPNRWSFTVGWANKTVTNNFSLSLNYVGTVLAISDEDEIIILKREDTYTNSWTLYGKIYPSFTAPHGIDIKLNGIGNKLLVKPIGGGVASLYEIV